MTKQEFLTRLRDGLAGLPEEELAERLAFYSELIDDRMEEGLSEAEAVAALGAVEEIAAQVAAETPLPVLVRERMRTRKRRSAGELVLLILGSPLWVPLLIAAAAVLFSLYVTVWALLLSLWASDLALALAAPGSVAMGLLMFRSGGTPWGLLLGAALVAAGLAIALFFGCRALSLGTVKLTKRMAAGLKGLLLRKERTV